MKNTYIPLEIVKEANKTIAFLLARSQGLFTSDEITAENDRQIIALVNEVIENITLFRIRKFPEDADFVDKQPCEIIPKAQLFRYCATVDNGAMVYEFTSKYTPHDRELVAEDAAKHINGTGESLSGDRTQRFITVWPKLIPGVIVGTFDIYWKDSVEFMAVDRNAEE